MSKQNRNAQAVSTDANCKSREMLLQRLNKTIAHLLEVYQSKVLVETALVLVAQRRYSVSAKGVYMAARGTQRVPGIL
jgi:hypothetical protein